MKYTIETFKIEYLNSEDGEKYVHLEKITSYVELWAWKIYKIKATIYPFLYDPEYSDIIKTQSDYDELIEFFYKECLSEKVDPLQSRLMLLLSKTLSEEIGNRLYNDLNMIFYSKLALIQQFLFVMENLEIRFESRLLESIQTILNGMVNTVSFIKEK